MSRFVFACFVFLCLLFLPFASFVSAAGVQLSDPKEVGQMSALVTSAWTVDVDGQSANSFSFSAFGLLNDSGQVGTFTSSHRFATSVDEFGNLKLDFTLDPTKKVQTVYLYSLINSTPETRDELVGGAVLDSFLRDSKYVRFSPDISAQADQVVIGKQNAMERAVALTLWVHNHVTYDFAHADDILDSTTVFTERSGVCNEFTHLLLAMLRSESIPARFVSGYVYSGTEWAPHAWAEAAIDGKWVPLDPTYNEAVVLDATHVIFARGIDQDDIKEKLSATAFSFDTSRISLVRNVSAEVSSLSGFSKPPLLGAFSSTEMAGLGEVVTITASLQNTRVSGSAFPVSLIAPVELELLDDKSALVYLPSRSQANVTWHLRVPENLSNNFVYSFPVILSSLGVQSNVTFKATSSAPVANYSELRISHLVVSRESISAEVVNYGNSPISNATATVFVGGVVFGPPVVFSIAGGKVAQLNFNNLNLTLPVRGSVNLVWSGNSTSKEFILDSATVPMSGSIPSVDSLSLNGENGTFLYVGVVVVMVIILLAALLFRKK